MSAAPHAYPYRSASLDLLLASVPSLPRPILARLTARMIERLDELDGEAVFETHEECRQSLQPQRIRLGRADEAPSRCHQDGPRFIPATVPLGLRQPQFCGQLSAPPAMAGRSQRFLFVRFAFASARRWAKDRFPRNLLLFRRRLGRRLGTWICATEAANSSTNVGWLIVRAIAPTMRASNPTSGY